MKVETFEFRADEWSVDPLPDLDSPETFVLAFGAKDYADSAEPLRDLCDAFPTSSVIGCSTSGEIFEGELRDGTIAVAVGRLESGGVRESNTPVVVSGSDAGDSRTAGATIGRDLATDDLRSIFVLCDGLAVGGTDLVAGIFDSVGPDVLVTGALAGDADRFESTWTLAEGQLRPGHVAAIGLYGPTVRVGSGARGGWDKFGPQREVTKAKGNVLYELDGQPALALYKQYLGDMADGLPQTGLYFPLSLDSSDDPLDEGLVRTTLSVDEDNQSLIFAGDIPVGALAKLMSANFDRLVEGAAVAGQEAVDRTNVGASGDLLAVGVSCVGRRLVLGERCEEEIEATAEALPPGAHQIGLYSYGELSPAADGQCRLHNQTMAVTTFAEMAS